MIKEFDAIVIGTGAGGYGSADWLYKHGVKNIAVLSEAKDWGTSRNTGSDKQTYYKLSLDGRGSDSAYKMAGDIMSGGSCDGEMAYIEAVNSARCFYRLLEYGVPFPIDDFGGFAGYQTDHDETKRATSIGPLTSKLMTEKLEDKVLNQNGTTLLDNTQVVKIIVKDGKALGVVAINRDTNEIDTILAKNIVAATGAPACIYSQSVYPPSQHGMTGVLINAGSELCNFTEWQYGMASTKFRWNVSGSYMQVVPRFVSVDADGNEHEFLIDYFGSSEKASSEVFLKGYQWPFSVDRAKTGSSQIDVVVHEEVLKGNKVYLDYTKNPADYDFDKLSDTAQEYLTKTGATGQTPFDRLKVMNAKAIELYRSHGIDIETEYLQIAVCAQHNNGGVRIDNNYQTNIDGLFAVGEVAGVFGITRQGGTALNSTQVGGLMAARCISAKPQSEFTGEEKAFAALCAAEVKAIADKFEVDTNTTYHYLAKKMSGCASFVRKEEECIELLAEIDEVIATLPVKAVNLSKYFYNVDMLASMKALLESIISGASVTGGRGGACYMKNGEEVAEDVKYRQYLMINKGKTVSFEPVKQVPEVDVVFEKLLEKNKEG